MPSLGSKFFRNVGKQLRPKEKHSEVLFTIENNLSKAIYTRHFRTVYFRRRRESSNRGFVANYVTMNLSVLVAYTYWLIRSLPKPNIQLHLGWRDG